MTKRRRPASKRRARSDVSSRQQRVRDGSSRVATALAWRPTVTVEVLAFAASLFFAVASNNAFWHALPRTSVPDGTYGMAAAFASATVLVGLQMILLCLILQRATAKVLLTCLLIIAAVFNHRSSANGIYLDPEAMRALLQSDPLSLIPRVSGDFLGALAVQTVAPALVLWRVRIVRMPWPEAIGFRLTALVIVSLFVTVAVQFPTDHVSRLLRQDKALRYLVIPSNVLAIRSVSAPQGTTPLGGHDSVTPEPDGTFAR